MRDKAEGEDRRWAIRPHVPQVPVGPCALQILTADSKSQPHGMQSPSHQKQQDSLDRVEVLQLDLQVK